VKVDKLSLKENKKRKFSNFEKDHKIKTATTFVGTLVKDESTVYIRTSLMGDPYWINLANGFAYHLDYLDGVIITQVTITTE
jgi:hypothetical protein